MVSAKHTITCHGPITPGLVMRHMHKAMRLNPHYPDYWVMQLGHIYFDARRYEDAISTLEKLHSNLALQTSLSARTDSKSFFAVLTIR